MSFDLGNTLRSVVLVVVCVAIVACIAFLIRSRRLEKTNFVRYCMVLAASDLSISICFISNFSGLGAAFKSDIYQQIVAGYIMVFGLFSLNTQALIAVERFMSARILIRARRPYTTSKFMAITLFGGFLPALLTTALMVSIMYPENTFEIDAQTMHFGVNWNPKSIQGISMIVMLLLLEYLTPLIVIGGCYASILTLHNKRAVFYTCPRISRRVRNINIMCMVSSMGFLVAWTPYATLGFLSLTRLTEIGGLLWLLANVCGKTCTIYNSALFYASTRQLEIPPSVIPSGPPDIPTVTGNQLNKQRAANSRTTAVGVRNLGMTVSTGPSPDMPYINSATSQRTELQLSPRREVVVGASPARSDRGSCSDQVYSGPYMTTSATTTHQH